MTNNYQNNVLTDNEVTFCPATKSDLLERAVLCGEWLLRNQITDRMDANRGRGIRYYNKKSGKTILTGNWPTGVQCMSLLALYRRTGREDFLNAAELAGRYLMSLQVLDQRQDKYFGTFREITPQSIEFAPRDATTAAWALVWLYNVTENPIYLDRAELFGRWHIKYAMRNGWPVWACFMGQEEDNMFWAGSFQSGTGLFYYDLFMATGESQFIYEGLDVIARNYRDKFFDKDGRIIPARDWFTGETIQSHGNSDMHFFNDDFGNAMLQTASDFFHDESFRQCAYRNTTWMAKNQNQDGGFDGSPSGVPVAMSYFNELGEYYKDSLLTSARDKALNKLLSMQFLDTGDPKMDGAFIGEYEYQTRDEVAHTLCVNNRSTCYALMALLKLESNLGGIWLGRHNRRFVDPNRRSSRVKLIW